MRLAAPSVQLDNPAELCDARDALESNDGFVRALSLRSERLADEQTRERQRGEQTVTTRVTAT